MGHISRFPKKIKEPKPRNCVTGRKGKTEENPPG
jgi:hypothetical protein